MIVAGELTLDLIDETADYTERFCLCQAARKHFFKTARCGTGHRRTKVQNSFGKRLNFGAM